MRTGPRWLVLTLAAALAAACAAKAVDSSERLCTPGNYVFCRCKNRSEGTKLCRTDGQSFEPCAQCSVVESIDAEAPPMPPDLPPDPDAGSPDDGATLPADAASSCSGRADGFNWMPPDPNQRCCGQMPVTTSSDSNCGACGITCNAANGETCAMRAGRYYCVGCATSAGCWSQCCSVKTSACAASDCVAGKCDATHCPPGTHCVAGIPDASSNYCAY